MQHKVVTSVLRGPQTAFSRKLRTSVAQKNPRLAETQHMQPTPAPFTFTLMLLSSAEWCFDNEVQQNCILVHQDHTTRKATLSSSCN